jgi:anaerobic ribonucleoside-triphosphate reductase activating protein
MSEPVRTPAPVRSPDQVWTARFLPSTRAEGPGERTAVWVQGCTIRCPGCFNPHMWSTRGGKPSTPDALVTQILDAGTDGLTLLGGEPFDQAAALSQVAAGVRETGRSVMTFTGYRTDELRRAIAAGRHDVAALLDQTDLLVAGPFIANQLDLVRPWVGSTNQEFVLLTNRIASSVEALTAAPDRLEITVDASGQVAINGWAAPAALQHLLDDL